MSLKYTLEDIEKFIKDYKKTQGPKPNDLMLSIPLVGQKAYEKAILEQYKRDFIEQQYEKAKNGSLEEQEDFIGEMTPILDDFYSKNKKYNR